ncbi:MAG: response regulator [Deinococcus sp.]|nr:response regulator [Deinococcus sp.]
MASERLLVIHDYEGIRSWLVDLLSASGYRSRGVANLAAACLAYQSQRPDLLILVNTGNEAATLQLLHDLHHTPETCQSRCLVLVEGPVSQRLAHQAQGTDTLLRVDLSSAQIHQVVQVGVERSLGHRTLSR